MPFHYFKLLYFECCDEKIQYIMCRLSSCSLNSLPTVFFCGFNFRSRCIIVFLLMLKLHSIGFALFNLAIFNFGSYTSLAHKSTYS